MFLWGTCSHKQHQALGWGAITDVEATLQVPRYKHFAEFFCGTGGLISEIAELRMRCAWLDYIVDKAHDMTTAHGFAHAIKIALSIMPGGVV